MSMNEIIVDLNGVIDEYGYFRSQVNYHLQHNAGQPVRLRLNSYGGSVGEALAISKLLEQHGQVTVELMGFAASAATWMGFAAQRVEMHEDTLWLCHKCSLPVTEWGYKNADELQSLIEELTSQKKSAEVIDLTIAKKYLDRCKDKTKTLQDILDLMKEERYLSPEDCLAWGFVDIVIPGINKSQVRNLLPIVNAMHFPPLPERLLDADQAADSLIDRLVERISNFFKKDETNPPTSQQIPTPQTQNDEMMNEQFTSVNQLLNVTGLTEQDGQVTLTVAQMQAIDAVLASVKTAEKALDEISDHVKNIGGLTNKVNALKLVLDRIPVSTPGIFTPADQDDNKIDSSKMNDPVNSFARKLKKTNK